LPEIFPSLDDEYVMTELFADGWISTHKHPGKISRELKKYREYYKKYKVYEGNIKNVFAAVSQWSGGNIKVYGFIPPSCKEMYDMESEISGFNEKDFVTRFKKAGGVWLDVDPSAYYSFDGCHLQSDAAMEFSRDLGEMISNLDDNVASAN
jgi:hypothetical protein